MAETKPLIGDVEIQLVYRPQLTSFVLAVAAARADQEQMAGYPLIMTKERHSHLMKDAEGEYYEVMVTFSPVPTVSEEQMQADPSLRPPVAAPSDVPPEPPAPGLYHGNPDPRHP